MGYLLAALCVGMGSGEKGAPYMHAVVCCIACTILEHIQIHGCRKCILQEICYSYVLLLLLLKLLFILIQKK